MATPYVQSVSRAFDVLDKLTAASGRQEGVVLAELARQTGLRRNTLHNLLRTMVVAGYAEALGGGRYREGPKCRALEQRNRAQLWRERLAPLFDELLAETDESIIFTTLAGTERLFIYHRGTTHPVRVATPLKEERHFFNLATSRVLAAWSTPTVRHTLVAQWGLPEADFATEAELCETLDQIKTKGFVHNFSHDGHVSNLALPALAPDGTLLGAVGCYLPTMRSSASRRRQLLAAMRRTAARVHLTLHDVQQPCDCGT